ncbi:MAG: copper resistance system multicopper oxidase, partial [Gammaproteobacteria bacterium]|nr:copper resistance system multicopper oxidase [Gammaproteobacteria bacterium]
REGMDHSEMDHGGGMARESAKTRENGMLAAGEAQPGSRYDLAGIGIDPNARRTLVY